MTEEPAAGASEAAAEAEGKPIQASPENTAVVCGYVAGEQRAVQATSRKELTTALKLIVDSSVGCALDVESEPTSTMQHWSRYRVRWPDGRRTRHLVGWADCEGMVCSAITAIDLLKRQLVTQSGRVYQLKGPSGQDKDAKGVWHRWLSINPVKDPSGQTKALSRSFDKAAAGAESGQTSLTARGSPT